MHAVLRTKAWTFKCALRRSFLCALSFQCALRRSFQCAFRRSSVCAVALVKRALRRSLSVRLNGCTPSDERHDTETMHISGFRECAELKSFITNLKLDRCMQFFNQHEITMEMLRTFSVDILADLNVGPRLRIQAALEQDEARGRVEFLRSCACHVFVCCFRCCLLSCRNVFHA